LRVREEFGGALLGLIWRTVPDLGQDCAGYVNAVKERAETDRLTPRGRNRHRQLNRAPQRTASRYVR
jgi:hypothetical protein